MIRRGAIVPVALLAACTAAHPSPPRTPPVAPQAPDAGAADVPDAPPPDARRVVEHAETPEFSADEAAWVPMRALQAWIASGAALPVPGAPEDHGARTTWTLLRPTRGAADPCPAITQREPRLACASDAVEHAGRLATRTVLGWRAPPGTAAISDVQPLVALSRAGRGACIASIERTEQTLDVTVIAPGEGSLGETLALLAVSPGLHALITVRVESDPQGLRALLSWPHTRATTQGMGADAWPPRCGGAMEVAAGAARGTPVVPLRRIDANPGFAAFVRAGRSVFAVVPGDTVAHLQIRSVDTDGIGLARPSDRRTTRLPWRP